MPTITQLTLYPIKSCQGIALQESVLGETGLSFAGVHDRQWMLVDAQGQFFSQRTQPQMARIATSIEGTHLRVSTAECGSFLLPLAAQPGKTITVQVWDDILPAIDEGDAAAAWFSQALGLPCRLVRFSAQVQRLASRKWTGDTLAPTRFADAYPILLISEASLADLNEKSAAMQRSAVPMNRFRPNIVVDGMEAFEEDYAEHFALAEQIRLRPVKPCTRCPMPAVDQLTGEIGDNPGDVLQTYRRNPLVENDYTFGMNLVIEAGVGQRLRVGDVLEMELRF